MVPDSKAPVRLDDAALIALSTLDPAAPLDDLEWLDEAIGEARVVAIGESAHGNREFYQLRHRFLRYLVERHGFDAYALESGFVEGWRVNDWVNGGADQLSQVQANGITFSMGFCIQMRDHLEWMREHNRNTGQSVSFYGIDLPGSCLSLLPGIDALIDYLQQADPGFDVDPTIRRRAASWARTSELLAPASFAAYKALTPANRNALTAGLAELAARMNCRHLDYCKRTGIAAYSRALQSLKVTISLDAAIRDLTRDPKGETNIRDAAMAQSVEWILDRHDRIVVAAHNGHVQRCPAHVPGVPAWTPMGMHLADRLGTEYLVIGTTCGIGCTPVPRSDSRDGKLSEQLEAPRAGSLDAVMADSHPGPFAVDLRGLSPTDTTSLRAISEQRIGSLYCDTDPSQAFDIIVYVPEVTLADPDPSAIAHLPSDVQQAFRHEKSVRP